MREHRLRATFQIATLAVVGLAGMAYATAQDKEHQLEVEQPLMPAPYVESSVTYDYETTPTLDLTWHSVNPAAYQTPTPIPPTPEPTRPPIFQHNPPPPGECPAIIVEVFGDTYAPAACRVAFCESRFNPNATGAQGEMGLFQIHPRWHADATYDPLGNTLAAYRISKGGTQWHAWSCKP